MYGRFARWPSLSSKQTEGNRAWQRFLHARSLQFLNNNLFACPDFTPVRVHRFLFFLFLLPVAPGDIGIILIFYVVNAVLNQQSKVSCIDLATFKRPH